MRPSNISKYTQRIEGIRFNNHYQTFFVFPIQFVGGYINNSNAGIQPNYPRPNPSSYAFFQKLFTGKEILGVAWSGAVGAKKPKGQNYYNYNYKKGDYYLGVPLSDNQNSTIRPSSSNSDFLGMTNGQDIQMEFYTNGDFEDDLNDDVESSVRQYVKWLPKEEDFFKVYLIPEMGGGKLFYISNCEYIRNQSDQTVNKVIISFSTLGDQLQNSGRAIEQYIVFSAIGERYAYPKVVYNKPVGTDENQQAIRTVEFDETRMIDRPVRRAQIEFQGAAGITTAYFMGRECFQDRINPPKHIFLKNLLTPTVNQINRTSTPSTSFYWCYDSFPTQAVSAEFWTSVKNAYQPTELMKDFGIIRVPISTDLEKTNPAEDGLFKTINDTTFSPAKDVPKQSYDTKGSPYTLETISINQSDRVNDIFMKNAFIYATQIKLPMSYEFTKIFYAKDIPIIGSFLNLLKLGDYALDVNRNVTKNSKVNFFVDIELYKAMKLLNFTSTQGVDDGLMLYSFFGQEGAAAFGTKGFSTVIKGDLTSIININSVDYDTMLLGQTKNPDGTNILPGGEKLLLDTNSKISFAIPQNGYIIDAICLQSFFSGDIKFTFFDANDNQVFTTTITSESNWTGNPRDWTVIFPLSTWNNNNCSQEDEFTYPQSIAYTPKEDMIEHKIEGVKFNYSMDIKTQPLGGRNKPPYVAGNSIIPNGPMVTNNWGPNIADTSLSIPIETTFTLEEMKEAGYDSVEQFLKEFKYLHIDLTKIFISGQEYTMNSRDGIEWFWDPTKNNFSIAYNKYLTVDLSQSATVQNLVGIRYKENTGIECEFNYNLQDDIYSTFAWTDYEGKVSKNNFSGDIHMFVAGWSREKTLTSFTISFTLIINCRSIGWENEPTLIDPNSRMSTFSSGGQYFSSYTNTLAYNLECNSIIISKLAKI